MIANIIVIEPDQNFGAWLEKTLIQQGYKVYMTTRSVDFLEEMDTFKFDLVICSYNLRLITPSTFYKQFTASYPEIPVIFISQSAAAPDTAELLAYKDVDFLITPITDAELLMRVKAALEPTKSVTDNVDEELTIQNITLCTKTLKVTKDDEIIVLSPTEFKLLYYLMQNKGRVLSRDMILSKVWGTTSDVTDRIVDVYIGYLRDKIDDKSDKKLIETVPGFGYRVAD